MTLDLWWTLAITLTTTSAAALFGYARGYRHSIKDGGRSPDFHAREREIAAARTMAQWEVRMRSDGVPYSPGTAVQPGQELRVVLARVAHLTSGESVVVEELLIYTIRGDSTTFSAELDNALATGGQMAARLNDQILGL